jgi:hypothetical protein
MQDCDDSQPTGRPDDAHHLWRAMQATFVEYMRAVAALEYTRHLTDVSPGSTDDDWTLTQERLSEDRRDAFERYVEARFEYLDHHVDETNRRLRFPPSRPTHAMGETELESGPPRAGWILKAAVVALAILTGFSLVRVQRDGRGLAQTRNELRVIDSATPESPAIQTLASAAPAPPNQQVTGEESSPDQEQQPQTVPQTSRKPIAARRELAPKSRGQHSYSFSLSRSRQPRRVGPIEVAVQSVDVQRNSVRLSILYDSGKVGVQHLRLNQPVWIKAGPHRPPVQLVVDRIAQNGLHCHMVELHG